MTPENAYDIGLVLTAPEPAPAPETTPDAPRAPPPSPTEAQAPAPTPLLAPPGHASGARNHRIVSTLVTSRSTSFSAARDARVRHVPGSLPHAALKLLGAAPPPPARPRMTCGRSGAFCTHFRWVAARYRSRTHSISGSWSRSNAVCAHARVRAERG
jgi:type IV secretory pathway VirB10-like protein